MMRMMVKLVLSLSSSLVIPLAASSPAQAGPDSFKETLLIRPLDDGKLHTRFQFELSTELPTGLLESPLSANVKLLQSDLVPLSVSEIVERFGIAQLSLSLSRGRWEHDRWTHPVDEDWQGYPRGAQLSVWLEPSSNSSALTNTLAGLFCASLNRLLLVPNPPPELFPPTSSATNPDDRLLTLYHGILPLEQPCTENLTPLLRLLPCGGQAGLSSLVDGHRLFDGHWQSLRFKLFKNPQRGSLTVEIEIETVFDQIRKTAKRDWNLNAIFGKIIENNCPLANSSLIEIVDVGTGDVIEPRAHPDGLPTNGKHTFDLIKAVLPLEIDMKWPKEDKFQYPKSYEPAPINVKRLLLGHGQTRGSMGVEIDFNEETAANDQEMIYFEEIPWWLSVYLHTLTIEIGGVRLKDPKEVIIKKSLKPSLQRQRPYSIALTLKLPSPFSLKGVYPSLNQTTKMKIEFEYEKDLLLYTEYPSDANRGFDLPPAGILLVQKKKNQHRLGHVQSKRFWTACGLISLATPDFSMPYNVIIVTSTAIALFFGSVFNLLVREFKLVKTK